MNRKFFWGQFYKKLKNKYKIILIYFYELEISNFQEMFFTLKEKKNTFENYYIKKFIIL